MVKFVEIVPDDPVTHTNDSAFVDVGVAMLIDFSYDGFEYTLIALLVLFTIILASLLKAKCLADVTSHIPESGILLLVGFILSLATWALDEVLKSIHGTDFSIVDEFHVNLPIFVVQHILIPPIILHASYELFNPQFFEQLWSILTMAFVGTMLNAVIIGIGLRYFFAELLWTNMNIFQCFTFASIISAVDPVAVLAIFEDVEADRALYFLVFGEALLNDGVTFVLYEGVKELAFVRTEDLGDVAVESYIIVLLSFLTAPLGGLVVGFLTGLLAALATKHMSEQSAYMKPMMNLLFAGFAYVITLVCGFSNILGIIAYGLTQTRYGVGNMSVKANLLTTSIVKTIAVSFETLLFFLLGSQFDPRTLGDVWDFDMAVILLITAARLLVTSTLCFLLNKDRVEKISWKWQAVMVVGGLRGAIAFAMVAEYSGPYNRRYYDCVVLVIVFTTLVQGIVAKPLVSALHLRKDKERNPRIRDVQRFEAFQRSLGDSLVGGSNRGVLAARRPEAPRAASCGWWQWLEQHLIAPMVTKKGDMQSAVMKELYEYEQHEQYLRQLAAAGRQGSQDQPQEPQDTSS